MKIASVDIGTNAVKSKIFRTTPTSIKYIDGIRSPIRLGAEVFKKGKLSEKKLKELTDTLKKYQKKFIKDGISQYEIVATSALRNTSNSEDARRYIENKIEHPIRIISGLEEAQLISFHPKAQKEKNKMYVDVGGGSTEIYIYDNSNHSVQSFQLGGVRLMLKKDEKNEWERMDKWLSQFTDIKEIIGVGGNIRAFLSAHKSKKMKYFITAMMIALTSSVSAQFYVYGYVQVPEDKIQEYIENEEEYFSQAAKIAIEQGVIEGWAILSRYQGLDSEPNFYWYVGIGDIDKLNDFNNDFGEIINQVSQKSGASSLISRALNDHSKYQTFIGTYYRGGLATNNKSDGWKYIRHNYAKVPNTGSWMNAQTENWGMFIDKNMNNGKVNQELWAASVRVHPTGNGYNWNVLTVDAFKSLKDW